MSSSQILLRIPKWVVVRMAGSKSRVKECHECVRWRLKFLALLAVVCVLGSLWVFCGVEDCGFWWKKDKGRVEVEEKDQVSLEHFNPNSNQLQALLFLLSTMGQKSFTKCLDKSMTEMPVNTSISQAIDGFCSKWDHLQSQQEQCPLLDGFISEKLKSSSPMGGHEMDRTLEDIIPSMGDTDVMLLKESRSVLRPRGLLKGIKVYLESFHNILGKLHWLLLFVVVIFFKGFVLRGILRKSSNQQAQQKQPQQKKQQDPQQQNSKVLDIVGI